MMHGEPKQVIRVCDCEGCEREFVSYEYPWAEASEYCSIECWAFDGNDDEKESKGETPEAVMRQTYHY